MQRLIGPLLGVLIVVGCSSAPVPTSVSSPPSTRVPDPVTDASEAPRVAPTFSSSTDVPATAGPTPSATETEGLPAEVWRTTALLDVRSGETFTINDLTSQGKLVVVEPMAIWCSNCRTQQNEARSALTNMSTTGIVYVSLDVDPNETEPDLARYADEREYPWHFAVASREVARSLAEAFGDQVLSPPSTPKIIVAPNGTAEVSFGLKRAAELEAQLGALLP